MVLSDEKYKLYYEKALKIRRLIKESLDFNNYDIIILPADDLSGYAISALAGLPSAAFNYNGYGIQLIANIKSESDLLSAWETVLK